MTITNVIPCPKTPAVLAASDPVAAALPEVDEVQASLRPLSVLPLCCMDHANEADCQVAGAQAAIQTASACGHPTTAQDSPFDGEPRAVECPLFQRRGLRARAYVA